MVLYTMKKKGEDSWVRSISTSTGNPVFTDNIAEAHFVTNRNEVQVMVDNNPELVVQCFSLVPHTGEVTPMQVKLVEVLEELNSIRPLQFLDREAEYVTNYVGVEESPEDGRMYIVTSSYNDNLPSHKRNPLRDGHGKIIPPDPKA